MSGLSWMSSATLPSASRSRRVRISRLVTLSPFLARQGAVVDREGHRQGRWVDRVRRDRLAHLRAADRIRHGRLRQPGDADDVAGARLLHRDALQAAEGQQLSQAAALQHLGAIAADRLDLHVLLGDAVKYPAGQDPAQIVVGFQHGGEQAERLGLVAAGLRHARHDALEQRGHVLALAVGIERRPAVLGAGEYSRKVELLLVRLQRGEQVEHLFLDLPRAGVRPVGLIDHHDRLQALGQRLHGDELGLRHRAFRRVDQQQHAVDHVEDPLDLAAEVGVARRIDDVDVVAVPDQRGALGQDGDAAFALLVVAVHRPVGDLLILAEGAALAQQLVDQGGFAVVDVGDDGEVAGRALADRFAHGLCPYNACLRRRYVSGVSIGRAARGCDLSGQSCTACAIRFFSGISGRAPTWAIASAAAAAPIRPQSGRLYPWVKPNRKPAA